MQNFDMIHATTADACIGGCVFGMSCGESGRLMVNGDLEVQDGAARQTTVVCPCGSDVEAQLVPCSVGNRLLALDVVPNLGGREPAERHVRTFRVVPVGMVIEDDLRFMGFEQHQRQQSEQISLERLEEPFDLAVELRVARASPCMCDAEGEHDVKNGRLMIRPSPTNPNAAVPEGWVARRGGHGTLSRELGGSAADHQGFAVILEENGTLTVNWLSRTLNPPPEYLVSLEARAAIIRAIEAATGRKVNLPTNP